MIRRLTYKILVLVACSALFAGCEQGFVGEWFDGPSGAESGDASLTITIEAPADDDTRAVPDGGTAAAGDKMNKLLALLVGGDNKIVARQEVVDTASGFTDATNKKAVITFDNLAVATYSVYLIANYESVTTVSWANYTVGASVGTALTDALVGATLTGTAAPSFETYGMPMTAELTTTLQHGTNAVSAEVERVVGRFGLNFYNHVVDAGYSVFVAGAELSAFNASSGYLFNHDYTVPAGNTYRKFFDGVSGSERVPTSEKIVPFDSYLYETDGAATYNLSFAVGVFEGLAADVTPTLSLTAAPDPENHNNIIADHPYLMYNVTRGVYLYMDGDALRVSATVPPENYNNYLWTFSTQNAGTIRNVGTSRWIRRNNTTITTTDSSGQATSFIMGNVSTTNKTIYFRYGSSDTRYFISVNNSNTVTFHTRSDNFPNSSDAYWTLREVKITPIWSINDTRLKANVYHSAPLTYDDEGYVKPLEQIKRNQNIQVGVNLFYNPKEGYFNFEVETWVDKTIDNVTFD